ncbi:immunity 22 family protein [Kordia algicida OT-1]|uniref:Uncharacterized protein n=1 Tax=Kordia algicida OT-1 TaxID=391587 RepID=A9DRL0_9FLAO|nr:immunity 22 family protein [Kordia algicida]EDP96809.1 hypothetical protein KAOT1_16638 [Kordia algicida OT-1]
MENPQKVTLFLGKFSSQKRLNSFLEEHYDEDAEVSSEFMEAFQIEYIDHDFQEVDFYTNKTSKEAIFKDFSYVESFIKEIPELDWKAYNSIILLYNFKYPGTIKETKNVKFIATFEYKEEANNP